MIIARIIFLSILISVHTVISSDINIARVYRQSESRGSYKYNHPPSAEIEAPFPDPTVHESQSTRDPKLLEISEKISIPEEQLADAKIQTESHSTLSYDNDDIVVKSAKYTAKSTIQPENKIPVAVVYEGTQNQGNQYRSEKNISFDTIKPRQRSSSISRRQQRQHFEDEKVELEGKKDSTNFKDTSSQEQVEGNSSIRKRTRVRDPVIPIVESENHVYSHTGKFLYSYESGDGTKAFETGELKSIDSERSGEAVVGGFSYKDKEGTDFSLSYTADENGYRPVGAHLPTPPPIPPAIARALRYLATKTTPEPVTKSYK